MTKISRFTPVIYIRPSSCAEGALSTLSNYFYLGGNRAKVVKNDEVQLEPGTISSCTIALKVASYVLLFPLTLTLLAINLGLRYQHNFTVISPFIEPRSAPNTESNVPPKKESEVTGISDKQVLVIPPTESIQKSSEQPNLDGHQNPIKIPPSHSPVQAQVTAQNVASVNQQVFALPKTENSLQPLEKSSSDGVPVNNSKKTLTPDQGTKPLSLKEFKKALQHFDTYDQNVHRMAQKLSEIAPNTLKSIAIVDLIFEQCRKNDIILVLDAFLIACPSFKLLAYNKIRRKIVEDERHTLNNSSFINLFKQHSLKVDENKLTACYDLAYRVNHPYIYRLSRVPIPPSDYSLNFLWVNLNPQDRVTNKAQNIFGEGLDLSENADCIKDPQALRRLEKNEESLKEERLEDWEKTKKSFIYRLSKWADVNRGGQIYLWYDSALVTPYAQQKTAEMMGHISKSRGVNLKLRDIRQLSNISDEIGHSLHPGTQVYYRIDILKALIADHMIASKKRAKYCVVSDIDVQPMSPQQMFDQRTVDYLSSNGYVFNRVSLIDNFESNFFIFNKKNKNLKTNHYEAIIKKTDDHIKKLRLYQIGATFSPDVVLDNQFVFKQYFKFQNSMQESNDKLTSPRKVVKCPSSQFDFGGTFAKSDYQVETFRFIGGSNVPYTRNGRNFGIDDERPIEALIRWKAEPLPLVE